MLSTICRGLADVPYFVCGSCSSKLDDSREELVQVEKSSLEELFLSKPDARIAAEYCPCGVRSLILVTGLKTPE
jgi:hypothetical protein